MEIFESHFLTFMRKQNVHDIHNMEGTVYGCHNNSISIRVV